MKIIACDACCANVNNYSYWYGGTPRNMYELKCVHESNDNTYEGMIICHECLERLIHPRPTTKQKEEET